MVEVLYLRFCAVLDIRCFIALTDVSTFAFHVVLSSACVGDAALSVNSLLESRVEDMIKRTRNVAEVAG